MAKASSTKAASGSTDVGEALIRVKVPNALCDHDDNGIVDFFDLLDFLNDWFAGNNPADFNADLNVDFFDLLDFLNCWFTA